MFSFVPSLWELLLEKALSSAWILRAWFTPELGGTQIVASKGSVGRLFLDGIV